MSDQPKHKRRPPTNGGMKFYYVDEADVIFDQLESELATANHQFKNFHRNLCERFGYCHDEKDWKRDQASLLEYIAGELKAAGAPTPKVQTFEEWWDTECKFGRLHLGSGDYWVSKGVAKAAWDAARSGQG